MAAQFNLTPAAPVDMRPFDSIESAQDFVTILRETACEAHDTLEGEIQASLARQLTDNQRDALLLARYKLRQLEDHLQTTSRLLNDLRSLRRFLFDERAESAADQRSAA